MALVNIGLYIICYGYYLSSTLGLNLKSIKKLILGIQIIGQLAITINMGFKKSGPSVINSIYACTLMLLLILDLLRFKDVKIEKTKRQ